MIPLPLQPKETILLHNTGVHRQGNPEFYTDELFLTNRNMIYVRKGFFGRIKNIQTYPLSQIKIQNGQAQVQMQKIGGYTPRLQIYFKSGPESFAFQCRGKKKILSWVTQMHRLLDTPDIMENIPEPSVPDAAPTPESTGVFSNSAKYFPPRPITKNCTGCGAPLSGSRGETVRCEYCDTDQTL